MSFTGNADFCKDDYGNIEKTCPDSLSFSETYCCGSPGFYYCCDSDDYDLYNEVADSISTAIIIVIVVIIIIVVGTIGGIIACCVCGCLCCARSRPVTRTYVTTQPVQGQTLIQQQAYYAPPGGAYPPPAGGEKAPNYPV
ncbi:protein shisa-5-like [Anneissia japonica]|uniref:protein shisa-5-like n=1 Tax=Anneissia japonica TaxID=1529436 RepID=UPI001425B1CB|nr:protein shisa-5-like [Anneissia japonica]